MTFTTRKLGPNQSDEKRKSPDTVPSGRFSRMKKYLVLTSMLLGSAIALSAGCSDGKESATPDSGVQCELPSGRNMNCGDNPIAKRLYEGEEMGFEGAPRSTFCEGRFALKPDVFINKDLGDTEPNVYMEFLTRGVMFDSCEEWALGNLILKKGQSKTLNDPVVLPKLNIMVNFVYLGNENSKSYADVTFSPGGCGGVECAPLESSLTSLNVTVWTASEKESKAIDNLMFRVTSIDGLAINWPDESKCNVMLGEVSVRVDSTASGYPIEMKDMREGLCTRSPDGRFSLEVNAVTFDSSLVYGGLGCDATNKKATLTITVPKP